MFYLWELEMGCNKHKHRIWPTHCLVGEAIETPTEMMASEYHHRHCAEHHFIDSDQNFLGDQVQKSTRGHEIDYKIRAAVRQWILHWHESKKVTKIVNFIDAGQNINTESYSVFKAEVQNHNDPSTGLNHISLAAFNHPHTQIFISGEALSHVVRCSLEDFIKKTALPPPSITLLLNCTSIVKSFIEETIAFIRRMMNYGVRIAKVKEDGTLEYIEVTDKLDFEAVVLEISRFIGRHPHNTADLKAYLEDQEEEKFKDRHAAASNRGSDKSILADDIHVHTHNENLSTAHVDIIFAMEEYGYIGDMFRAVRVVKSHFLLHDACNFESVRKMLSAKVVILQVPAELLSNLFQREHRKSGSLETLQSDVLTMWIMLIIGKYIQKCRPPDGSEMWSPISVSNGPASTVRAGTPSYFALQMTSSAAKPTNFDMHIVDIIAFTNVQREHFDVGADGELPASYSHSCVDGLGQPAAVLPAEVLAKFAVKPKACIRRACQLLQEEHHINIPGELWERIAGFSLEQIFNELMINTDRCTSANGVAEVLGEALNEKCGVHTVGGTESVVSSMTTVQIIQKLERAGYRKFSVDIATANLKGSAIEHLVETYALFKEIFTEDMFTQSDYDSLKAEVNKWKNRGLNDQ
jgi:nicotinamidase-related amidase